MHAHAGLHPVPARVLRLQLIVCNIRHTIKLPYNKMAVASSTRGVPALFDATQLIQLCSTTIVIPQESDKKKILVPIWSSRRRRCFPAHPPRPRSERALPHYLQHHLVAVVAAAHRSWRTRQGRSPSRAPPTIWCSITNQTTGTK